MTGDDQVPGQLPLPGVPVLPLQSRGHRAAAGASYIRYRTAVPVLCDDCTRAIHRLGVARAPFPSRARWKRIGPDGEIHLLCAPCKDARKDTER